MTMKSNNLFINGIYSKGPKQIYPTDKIDVCHNDDIWSLVS